MECKIILINECITVCKTKNPKIVDETVCLPYFTEISNAKIVFAIHMNSKRAFIF